MVFKGRFFSSSKKSSDSDGSPSSPRTPTTLNSPNRSEKKKVKSDPTAGASSSGTGRQTLLKDATRQQQQRKDKGKGLVFGKDKHASVPATPKKKDASPGGGSLSPIMASSLGLNRIKTRSGPLPMERSDRGSSLGPSKLARGPPDQCSTSSSALGNSVSGRGTTGKKKLSGSLQKVPEMHTTLWSETDKNPIKPWGLSASGDFKSLPIGQSSSSRNQSARQIDARILEAESPFDAYGTPKESESPRFKAIMQVTSAPQKRFPADIKSFSHELNSKGVRPYPFWKPRGKSNLKEVLKLIHVKFEKAKEEVNSDLATFAGELVDVMENNAETHPDWKETLEDLLLLARSCVITSPGDFWLQCEGIVQDLDDQRQELQTGVLKKLHTRMLFILTRCTRLLQFHKESVFADDEIGVENLASSITHFSERKASEAVWDGKSTKEGKSPSETASARKSYSQEHGITSWRKSHEICPPNFFPTSDVDVVNNPVSSSNKPLSPTTVKNQRETPPTQSASSGIKVESSQIEKKQIWESTNLVDLKTSIPPELSTCNDVHPSVTPKHEHKNSWGYWGDQQAFNDEETIICRICEEYVPTSHVENHLKVCTIADRCDKKGLSVDERLIRIAETLEKMVELCSQADPQNSAGIPDVVKTNLITEESDIPSPKLGEWSRPGSADMFDCFQGVDNIHSMDDLKGLSTMTCKTRLGQKSDQGMATSSGGSMTPRSPLLTPETGHIDALLAGKCAYEGEDLPQIIELSDIARCIANASIHEDHSLNYLVSCLEDLQEVVDHQKLEALTVQTFGARIEKLHREKYMHLCDMGEVEKVDATSAVFDEEEDVVRSLRTSPVHSSVRDRTSIDDFEIIKPISRGAFGRVFLAKKRTTGDLFAIKVLRKADMIRKNAVESILAERDILISVRNPFVVRFFYSFTSRENLYLVMEYLNGGDLYSLLRNLGALDEEIARIYIAEVVLALEYLHSLRVVHRDLKPDNLLIAHDGHIKLTDFGLSKVGLINSTDELSGPAVSGTPLMGEDEPQLPLSEDQRERRKKRSAVGTPDYLAPEILLGTGHGASADWWSVGVILFELVVGIPPFNDENPQAIFDNILNRKIPWPQIPGELSFEACDLIDKLLREDPIQRLGAEGATEVKRHVFFKDINWDTLARQKAAFVPSSDSALDTSYFSSRYSWNPSDERINEANEYQDLSTDDSMSNGSCISNHNEEPGEHDDLSEFDESGSTVNYSFSNFSFKNLSQLAAINYDLLSKGWREGSAPNN